MAITESDIKLYRGAKRDQTDTAGGLPSGVVVVDGVVNNLFSNIARLDRVRGDISLEKFFVGVASSNTDMYKGTFMAVCDPPFDKNVNVMLFKAPTYSGTRDEMVSTIESYFNLGVAAGNASLAYEYQPGAEQILYLLRWYEYSPRYSDSGTMLMATKYDLKQTMNLNIGDIVWLGDETKGNGEYIEIKGLETLYESMPDSDATHYYNKVYLSVQLASPLENAHYKTDVTKRTTRNTAWEAFGCMRLSAPLVPGDAYASIVDTTGRIIPVIERNQLVKNQVIYQPPSLKDNVTLSYGGLTLDMEQVKQLNLSEETDISGQSVNHSFEYGPVDPATVVFRYRHQKQWVVCEADANGVFSGDAVGAVSASGQAMALNLLLSPDYGTVGIVTFSTQHQFEMCSSTDLTASFIAGTVQTEIRNIAEGITSYSVVLASGVPARLRKGQLKIYALVNNAYALVAQDDMYGALGGELSGTVSYTSNTVTITSFGTVSTRALKFEYSVDLFRKRVFDQDDFSTGAGGLSYVLNAGSGIVKPEGRTELYSKITMTFDVWDSPAGTPELREVTKTWSGTSFNTITGAEPDSGYMIGGSSLRVWWGNAGLNIDLFQTGLGPLIDYVNGTISFPLDGGCTQPVTQGSSPDAALKSISVEVFLTDDGSFGYDLPLPLHFNRTNLVKGGVTGTVVNPDGAFAFYDNKMGVLKLVKAGLVGSPETVVTDLNATQVIGILSTPSGLLMAASTGTYFKIYASLNGGTSWVMTSSPGIAVTKIPLGYGSITGYGEFYVFGISSYVYYSKSIAGPWMTCNVLMSYVNSIAFGNGVAVLAGSTPNPMLAIISDGFETEGTQVSDTSGSFGSVSKIAFGKDTSGNGRFVCVSQAGKVWYGAGAPDGTGWEYSILPWADTTCYLRFSEGGGEGVWVCAGKNNHIAWSKDGVTWADVSTTFMDVADTAIYGLSVSTDGLFMVSGTVNKYSSRDGYTWTMESAHPAITSDSQYLMTFHTDVWVELWSDLVSVLSLVKQSQATPLPFTDIGTIDYETGEGELTRFDDIMAVSSSMYLAERSLTKFAVQTRGADPVTPGTFRLSCAAVSGKSLVCTGNDVTLDLSGDATGTYSAEHGFAYGEWSEPYLPETLMMDAGYKSMYHPDLPGINEKALPLDGRVPLIKKDALAMITDKGSYRLAADLNASDLFVVVEDIAGWPPELPDPCLVTIGSETLKITSQNESTLTVDSDGRGYDGTIAASHVRGATVTLTTFNMELNPVASVGHGTVQFANDVAHSYSRGAVVSAVIESGDLQAVLEEYHTQNAWDGVTWYNTTEWDYFVLNHNSAYNPGPAGGVYNFTDYPMILTNVGAVTERWMIEITSTSPLMGTIRGEYLGVIATNVPLTSNVSLVNPNVGVAYFFMNSAGWGGGWQVGNLLRFNTEGALAAAWAMRVVEAKASTASDDGAEIWVGGDVPVA